MTREQQILLDKAARSLQAARELNQTGFAEFAASRAYYAMFYVATAFLEGEGLLCRRNIKFCPRIDSLPPRSP